MVEIRSYSIDELEELTGFNQRTISYYIQQGLLPKVGRRGRSTRYPQLFVDRLKFIQRVRDLQDSGRLGSVTLPRIARVIWHLIEQSGDSPEFAAMDDREIQQLFEGETIPDERVLGESTEGDSVKVSFGKFGPYVRAGEATASIDAQEFNSITLEDALSRISEKQAEKEKRLIKEFDDAGIRVLDGPYGPYVRHRGVNAKIPKNVDPTQLTIEDCESLIEKKRDKLATKSASKRRDRLSSRVEGRRKTEIGTKLDLARSYIDMGDPGGARSILEEVLDEGEVAAASQADQEKYKALVGETRPLRPKKATSLGRDKPAARRKDSVREDIVEEYAAASMEPSMIRDELLSFSEEPQEAPHRLRPMAVSDFSPQLEGEPDRLIEEIERQVQEGRGRAEGRTETWTRAPITENIEITVQGIDPEQAELVDSLAQRIRKLLGVGSER
jgi:FimV-like protein